MGRLFKVKKITNIIDRNMPQEITTKIALFKGKQIRKVIHSNEWWFSVIDIILVLTESSKKGPLVAAQALMNISQYIKQMHTVNERLQDLMSETISSMKSQIKFLTPVISGIVIGITSMITTILGKLSTQMKKIQEGSATGAGMPGGLSDMFGDGIPAFYFQLIVGIYVIQLAYILTILINGIENGSDKLGEKYNIGINVTKGTTIYCFLATVVMIGFNFVAGSILGAGK